jgi:hypothetical protein
MLYIYDIMIYNVFCIIYIYTLLHTCICYYVYIYTHTHMSTCTHGFSIQVHPPALMAEPWPRPTDQSGPGVESRTGDAWKQRLGPWWGEAQVSEAMIDGHFRNRFIGGTYHM